LLYCLRTFLPSLHFHLLLSFFFSSYGAPRDLHSFPTRRSSDLPAPPSVAAGAARAATQSAQRRIGVEAHVPVAPRHPEPAVRPRDRKSTRLNSSHVAISYAVFCLKKKKSTTQRARRQ